LNFRKSGGIVFFLLVGHLCWSYETPPVASFTFFGIYGSPVQPTSLASSNIDGLGYEALAEWNAMQYISLGLSYETTTFYGTTNYRSQMANLEGRFFLLTNRRAQFSPYVFGGAGLSLADSSTQLKAGIGSRIPFAGPVHLDFAVGSHWIQPPANYQYVDARFGLSYSFDINQASDYSSGSSNSSSSSNTTTTSKSSTTQTSTTENALAKNNIVMETPGASPTTVPTQAPTVYVTMAPTATATPQEMTIEEPTPTPAMLYVESGPVSLIAARKSYYKRGMNAFLKAKYQTALLYLKKSISLKEAHVAKFYYAEAYATIGVIYHFHSTVANHKKLAYAYYKRALSIDPTTKAAKKYIKLLKPKAKLKVKPKPVSTDDSTGANGSSAASSGSGSAASSSSGSSTSAPATSRY
jgi:tetratricopeptide (TPR) repeat protein